MNAVVTSAEDQGADDQDDAAFRARLAPLAREVLPRPTRSPAGIQGDGTEGDAALAPTRRPVFTRAATGAAATTASPPVDKRGKAPRSGVDWRIVALAGIAGGVVARLILAPPAWHGPRSRAPDVSRHVNAAAPTSSAASAPSPNAAATNDVGPADASDLAQGAGSGSATDPTATEAMIRLLVRCGDAAVGVGDIVAARLLYERAANLGSGDGARSMGKTYDAEFLRRAGVHGIRADQTAATAWFHKATALGDRKSHDAAEAKTPAAAVGDVITARPLYERAAALGSASAATAAGETYDIEFLPRDGAGWILADPAATAWFRKAAALGDSEARGRLVGGAGTSGANPGPDAAVNKKPPELPNIEDATLRACLAPLMDATNADSETAGHLSTAPAPLPGTQPSQAGSNDNPLSGPETIGTANRGYSGTPKTLAEWRELGDDEFGAFRMIDLFLAMTDAELRAAAAEFPRQISGTAARIARIKRRLAAQYDTVTIAVALLERVMARALADPRND